MAQVYQPLFNEENELIAVSAPIPKRDYRIAHRIISRIEETLVGLQAKLPGWVKSIRTEWGDTDLLVTWSLTRPVKEPAIREKIIAAIEQARVNIISFAYGLEIVPKRGGD